MFFWLTYVIFSILFGFWLGKISLRVLRYPERYHRLVRMALFPLSTIEYGEDPFVSYSDKNFSLFSICDLDSIHLYEDTPPARMSRLIYIAATMVTWPLRLIWIGVYLSYVLVVWAIFFTIAPIFRKIANFKKITDV